MRLAPRILFPSLVLAATLAAMGCGGDEPEEPAATSGAEADGLTEEQRVQLRRVLLPGCQSGCDTDAEVCEGYCSCALAAVEADPELAAIALDQLEDVEKAAHLQQVMANACGEVVYSHYFVAECAEVCEADTETSASVCLSRCQCLYDTIRARHPGSEGLSLISAEYGADDLSEEAEAELREVAPACNL